MSALEQQGFGTLHSSVEVGRDYAEGNGVLDFRVLGLPVRDELIMANCLSVVIAFSSRTSACSRC